ncbi:hypothetical protein [uncultured Methylibium sp.]|uniref:hypothetical protein n=1 Tax=uncultured Methylibium sp. TaxID=381093 RepID=UPI0025CDE5A4|nr:hypothetical protein [uncultured Methylibium sp.]
MNRRQTLHALLAAVALPAAAQDAPPPDPALAAVQGAWRGTLSYRDYSRPDRVVTLPTRLYIALLAPHEIALHYVFDDGPGKTVHSYERMAFDFGAKRLTWISGDRNNAYDITSVQPQDGARAVSFERQVENSTHRYAMLLGAQRLTLGKEEGTPSAGFQFRNRFEFTRGEA